jgi:hypothetical protein
MLANEPVWVDALVLLLTPVALVVGGYLLLRRGNGTKSRMVGCIMIAVVAAMFGAFGLAAYAIPGLDDFRNPGVSFQTALVGNPIMWTICLGALALAFRAVWSEFRN